MTCNIKSYLFICFHIILFIVRFCLILFVNIQMFQFLNLVASIVVYSTVALYNIIYFIAFLLIFYVPLTQVTTFLKISLAIY